MDGGFVVLSLGLWVIAFGVCLNVSVLLSDSGCVGFCVFVFDCFDTGYGCDLTLFWIVIVGCAFFVVGLLCNVGCAGWWGCPIVHLL